jgi:hypothetical protein
MRWPLAMRGSEHRKLNRDIRERQWPRWSETEEGCMEKKEAKGWWERKGGGNTGWCYSLLREHGSHHTASRGPGVTIHSSMAATTHDQYTLCLSQLTHYHPILTERSHNEYRLSCLRYFVVSHGTARKIPGQFFSWIRKTVQILSVILT